MIRARAATACLYGLVDCITCCKASAHIWQELGMQRSAQLMGGALANILGNYVLQRLFALLGERLSTHKQKMLATSPSERIIRCWPEIFTLASAVRRPPFLEISRHVELIPVQLEFICSRMKLHTVRVRNESKVWWNLWAAAVITLTLHFVSYTVSPLVEASLFTFPFQSWLGTVRGLSESVPVCGVAVVLSTEWIRNPVNRYSFS